VKALERAGHVRPRLALPFLAPNDRAADVADLGGDLIAVSGTHGPAEERLVERRAPAEIGHLERDVIEVQRVPACPPERRRRRALVPFVIARFAAARRP
jgi:hypothetical protein